MFMGNFRELTAEKLSIAICDAIYSKIPVESFHAQRWLLLHKCPTPKDVATPAPGGFIEACRLLELNWYELRKSVMEALEITDTEMPASEVCALKLVQSFEPRYNDSYGPETNSHSFRTRANKRG